MLATLEKIESGFGAMDLAVMAAGTYSPVDVEKFDTVLFEDAMTTNYLGVVNCLARSAAAHVASAEAGHVAWIASVAGFVGLAEGRRLRTLQGGPDQSGRKPRSISKLRGVTVSVVNPGFVETPLTAQNDFAMPFLMQAPDAARLTIEGLKAAPVFNFLPPPALCFYDETGAPDALRAFLSIRSNAPC